MCSPRIRQRPITDYYVPVLSITVELAAIVKSRAKLENQNVDMLRQRQATSSKLLETFSTEGGECGSLAPPCKHLSQTKTS